VTEIARSGEAQSGVARSGQDRLLRSASSGAAGASTASRTVTLQRTAVAGDTGASTASRTISLQRTAATGSSGASTAARVLSLVREATSVGAAGASTASRAYQGWAIEPLTDDPTMAIASNLTADAETISLSFEIHRDTLDAWRRFDRAGDISVESGFAGQFGAKGRDGQDGTVTVEPAGEDTPPFPRDEYFVASFDEEQLAPDRQQISLSLQRLSNRGQEFATLTETGDWEFALEIGTVGLDESQVSPASGSGTTSGPEYDLELRVGDDQAAALLDNWGFPDGVVERSVGDGENFLVDESPDSRQTVAITAPNGAAIDDGDYFVTGWSIEQAGFEASRRWSVDVTLAEP
jgi:hypothetical protein